MSRPDADLEWAEGASAEIAEPSDALRETGWTYSTVPTAGTTNAILRELYRALAYVAKVPPYYTDLADAYADLADGDVAMVYEADSDDVVGGTNEVSSGGAVSATILAVHAIGDAVLYCETDAHPMVCTRADTRTVVRTFTRTNIARVTRLLYADGYVFATMGNYVEAWTYATGASVWRYDHGAAVRDIAWLNNRLCVVGASGTTSHEVVGLNAATGTVLWEYSHGGTVNQVVAANGTFIIGGAASSHASGATIRALYYASGNDEANEGGTAIDAQGLAWDLVTSNAPSSSGRLMAADRRIVVWADRAANEINVLRAVDGGIHATVSPPSGDSMIALALDQDYILVTTDTGYVYAFDRLSLAPVWRYNVGSAYTISSDGCAVWLGVTPVSGARGLLRLRRGNRPHLFRRSQTSSGAADAYRPGVRRITAE